MTDPERIQALGLWRGPIAIDPLPGGITNRNYVVRHDGPALVVRICGDGEPLGIDRRNEAVCHRAAEALGLVPPLIHEEDGLLVGRFVPGTTLTEGLVGDPAMLARIARLLRALHESRDDLIGSMLAFPIGQVVRTYAATAHDLGAALPGDLDAMLAAARELARAPGPFRPTLCHNDLLPGNLIDDGARLWLIDWEYAGIGHPLFDLANLAANAGLDDDRSAELLDAYGTSDWTAFRAFRALSHLREALWAAIQSAASELDFDFIGYSQTHFDAFRRGE